MADFAPRKFLAEARALHFEVVPICGVDRQGRPRILAVAPDIACRAKHLVE
jgi:hypothetical protein